LLLLFTNITRVFKFALRNSVAPHNSLAASTPCPLVGGGTKTNTNPFQFSSVCRPRALSVGAL